MSATTCMLASLPLCVCVCVCSGRRLAQLVAGLYDMPAALSMLLFQGLTVKGQRTTAQPDTNTNTNTSANGDVAVDVIALGENTLWKTNHT